MMKKKLPAFDLCCISLLILLSSLLLSSGAPARQTKKKSACTAPEYRQFDFWVGDWDAFEAGVSGSVARLKANRILDGCVLREQYAGLDGHQGESFSIYDQSRKMWHQTWVTNRGELLTIEGSFKDREMILSGADQGADGKKRLVRGVWKPDAGGVRETAVQSLDGGKNWEPWFDLEFRPHR
jgi:hypothetical protein